VEAVGGKGDPDPTVKVSERERKHEPPASGDGRPNGSRTDQPMDSFSYGERQPAKKPFAFLRELPGLIIIAFLLALLIKSFLIQAFYIPSQSMEPTLEVGDRVLVNKVVLRFRDPHRGEVIVFENPQAVQPDRNPLSAFWNWLTEGLGLASNPEKDFIKRVIGLPGETIEVNRGKVFINGKPIDEPYLNEQEDLSDFGPFKVPADQFFMMGDNRANSQDSRSTLGPIPKDKIVGKAFIVLWPPSSFEWEPSD
jgi:signal peptidase I